MIHYLDQIALVALCAWFVIVGSAGTLWLTTLLLRLEIEQISYLIESFGDINRATAKFIPTVAEIGRVLKITLKEDK